MCLSVCLLLVFSKQACVWVFIIFLYLLHKETEGMKHNETLRVMQRECCCYGGKKEVQGQIAHALNPTLHHLLPFTLVLLPVGYLAIHSVPH